MKKIVFVLTVFFAFSLNANAQSKKELTKEEIVNQEKIKNQTPEENAKSDAMELSKFLDLNENQTNNMYRLLHAYIRWLRLDGVTRQSRRCHDPWPVVT